MRSKSVALKAMGRGFLALTVALTVSFLGGTPASAINEGKLSNDGTRVMPVKHYPVTVDGTVGTTTRNHLGSYSEALRNVYTFRDHLGQLNVASHTTVGVCVQVYDSSLQVNKQFLLTPRYAKFGGITCDSNGNYYVVWAQYDSDATNCITMCIAKYDNNGTFLKELTLSGYDTDNYGNTEYGTRYPFQFGNTSLAVQNGILALNYARVMYSGHQSNLVVYVDCDTMERKYADTCYTSHSFDQRAYATADGTGFVFLNQGDAYNRGFKMSVVKLSALGNSKQTWYSGTASTYHFHFREGSTRYQEIFSQMGGMAEVNAGYVFLGASERALDFVANPRNAQYIDGRDLFIQILKKNFSSYSGAAQYALAGETRTAQKNNTGTAAYYYDESSVDYGVVWLTNYDADHYASNPKIVAIGDEKFAILWEKRSYSDGEVSTYYAVMDASGNVITDTLLLQDCLLAADTDPVFRDGKIYWTTNDNNGFRINELDVNAQTQAYHDHEYIEMSRDGNNVTLECTICGAEKKIVTTSSVKCYLSVNGGGYMWSSAYESGGLSVNAGDTVSVYMSCDSGSTDVMECEIHNEYLAAFEDGSAKKNVTNFFDIVTKAGGKVKVTITPKYVSNPAKATFYLNIAGDPPIYPLSGTVHIVGEAVCGQTLTAQVSDTNNSGTLSYQWKRGNNDISGATASEYVLTKDDIGKVISCVVTSSVETGSITGTTDDVVEDSAFLLAGANMNLGNSLAMNFYVGKDKLDASKRYYAEITKEYADGKSTVRRIPMDKWSSYSDELYKITFSGIAAKEMNDGIAVQIFEEDGTAVSQIWNDSVVKYVRRAFDAQTTNVKRAMVDMLNYGAEAQKALDYDENNLANSWLSAAQKAYASEAVAGNNQQKKELNYEGCNLNLGSNLCMNMYFRNLDPTKYGSMYATLTYVDHNDKERTIRVNGSRFMKYSETLTNVRVEVLAVAEVNRVVNCKVYDGKGNLLGDGSDSIGGYIARQTTTNALFDAIMKFSSSAYKCFHP